MLCSSSRSGGRGVEWDMDPSLVPGHTCALFTFMEPFPCALHCSTETVPSAHHPIQVYSGLRLLEVRLFPEVRSFQIFRRKFSSCTNKIFLQGLGQHFITNVTISSKYGRDWASQVVLVVKNLPANAGDIRDTCSIPGSGRFPGGGNGNPLQYSCLENSTDNFTLNFISLGTTVGKNFLLSLVSLPRKHPLLAPGASQVVQVVKNPPVNTRDLQETQVQSLNQEDPVEKGMATHSSILAWRIPWAEETGRLQPMVSQRVGHNWATNTLLLHQLRSLGFRSQRSGTPLLILNSLFGSHKPYNRIIGPGGCVQWRPVSARIVNRWHHSDGFPLGLSEATSILSCPGFSLRGANWENWLLLAMGLAGIDPSSKVLEMFP